MENGKDKEKEFELVFREHDLHRVLSAFRKKEQ